MWLLKTEPGEYSYDDLEREERGRWDGVTNPVALRNLRAMKRGDRVLVYHTGDERAVVGRPRWRGRPTRTRRRRTGGSWSWTSQRAAGSRGRSPWPR